MTDRAAMLYARGGRAFIVPESLTVDGFWVASSPCLVESLDAPDAVADCALRALEASRSGVPTPPPTERLEAELLERAGVKSFGTFMKGALAVRLTAGERGIILTPMRNAGARSGFEFKERAELDVEDMSELVSGIAAALEAAE